VEDATELQGTGHTTQEVIGMQQVELRTEMVQAE